MIIIQKNVKIVVPLKYISNYWRTLEMPLINDEISLILNGSANCVIVVSVGVLLHSL